MDTSTLRVAFAVLALTMLVLFYLITYRGTRSEFCGWWCVSLAMFLAGSSAYLLDETDQQVWSNPLGNVLIVLGGVAVWNGTRSLRTTIVPWWAQVLAPAVVAVASVLDHPSTNTWSGGPFFLAAMSLTVGAASTELWLLQHDTAVVTAVGSSHQDTYRTVLRAMAATSSAFAIFYAMRTVAFLAVGSSAAPFTTVFGSQVTTLMTSVLLSVVSFSMSSLSNEQQTGELRERASTDGLTGLLNRTAFTTRATQRIASARRRGTGVGVVLVDVDRFKDVNDQHGHGAGDEAIRRVADACLQAVRDNDVVARLGGDEFVLLLPGATPDRARQVADAIRVELRSARSTLPGGATMPTVSCGIAMLDLALGLDDALARADAALYAAKAAGRDASVHDLDLAGAGGESRTA